MRRSESLSRAGQLLCSAGIENFAAEARWLAEFCGQRGEGEQEYLALVQKRAEGYPLQYILGSQQFAGIDILVGEGVLIPRPDTEALVDAGLEALQGVEDPIVYDLCAGSGCVGLAICKKRPDAAVTAVDCEEPALVWLRKNVAAHPDCNINVVKANIISDNLSALPPADLILANPPYIRSADMGTLQREVLAEPAAALDGGRDGLDFYAAIAALAAGQLKDGAALAMEVGDGMAADVCAILERAGFYGIKTLRDCFGFERVVSSRRPAAGGNPWRTPPAGGE